MVSATYSSLALVFIFLMKCILARDTATDIIDEIFDDISEDLSETRLRLVSRCREFFGLGWGKV